MESSLQYQVPEQLEKLPSNLMENGVVSVTDAGMIKMPKFSVNRWDLLMVGLDQHRPHGVQVMCGLIM